MILGKGMISLALWESKGLSFQIEQANKKVRKELLMNGEELVALLVENEIGVKRTPLQLIEIEAT
jgi:restriction endonuclease Mrr